MTDLEKELDNLQAELETIQRLVVSLSEKIRILEIAIRASD